MSGWAQRDAEEREDRSEAVIELDNMLNEAQEAAGVDDHAALLTWIRERRAEDWQPIESAPKEEIIPQEVDVWLQVPASPRSMGMPDGSACILEAGQVVSRGKNDRERVVRAVHYPLATDPQRA